MDNGVVDASANHVSKCSHSSVGGKLCNFGNALMKVTMKIFVRLAMGSLVLVTVTSYTSACVTQFFGVRHVLPKFAALFVLSM